MRFSIPAFALSATALLVTPDTTAQVRVNVANGVVQLQTASLGTVRITRAASKSASDAEWTLTDAQGLSLIHI